MSVVMVEPARAAATIVLVRDATSGPVVDCAVRANASSEPQVLVLRRAAAARFAPGFVVFPGGAVDPADADLAARWFGTRDEAARACAVRELAEETGLLLNASGIRSRAGSSPVLHHELDKLTPPAPDRLPEIARWIAPDFLPTRFDARFFAAAVSGDAVPTIDAREAEHAWWTRPSEVLEQHRVGSIELAWPTFKSLEALAGCSSVAEVLALRIEQVPPPLRSHVAPRPGPAPRAETR
jgi:8-oxo-dGTP pyrophosphatase MutT (NUDIX family)